MITITQALTYATIVFLAVAFTLMYTAIDNERGDAGNKR